MEATVYISVSRPNGKGTCSFISIAFAGAYGCELLKIECFIFKFVEIQQPGQCLCQR